MTTKAVDLHTSSTLSQLFLVKKKSLFILYVNIWLSLIWRSNWGLSFENFCETLNVNSVFQDVSESFSYIKAILVDEISLGI